MKKGKCSQTETALHVHDLISYKRCRRKWGFTSPFREHLESKPMMMQTLEGIKTNVNQHLWFGSGFHFALEDYEGHKRFPDAVTAFEAYIEAHTLDERPTNWEELRDNGITMLTYYQEWAKEHKNWHIVRINGKPLVETKYSLVLDDLCYYENKHTGERIWAKDCDPRYSEDENFVYKEIVMHGTFDAIVEDEYHDWWVLDYKTAAAFDTAKLDLDQQVSVYCWAASQWFQKEIQGMVYVQVHKNPPTAPKITKTGVSTDKRQRTTAELYLETCREFYGTDIPAKQMEFYETLKEEDPSTKFINVQWVERTVAHQEQTFREIIAQGKEILDPDLPLYPNPTKDCSWDCPFIQVCKAQQEGADYQYLLEEMFQPRVETLTDDLRMYERRLAVLHPELFPEWYQEVQEKYRVRTRQDGEIVFDEKKETVDIFEEFR